MNEAMTSRERVMTALQHKETDRVPLSLGFYVNHPAMVQLQKHLKLKDLNDVHGYLQSFSDLAWTMPEYKGPKERPVLADFAAQEYTDMWGVTRRAVKYGEGVSEGVYHEISYSPLANAESIDDVNKHLWPSPEWLNVTNLRGNILNVNKDQQKANLLMYIGNIFETAWSLTGFQKMFMDMMVNPDLAWEILTRVTDGFIAYYKKMLDEADGLIDIVFTGDDISGQNGLLMSYDLWEKMIKPHHVRMNKVLHEYGVKILYHSCGAVMKAVPGLMDMGVDILEALQFDAKGMDPVLMKNQYGDKLCFHGGISVQKTLPFGTAEDVRNEVMERIEVLGKNGGYILAPAHAVQAGTPPENIVAMFETAKNYKRK